MTTIFTLIIGTGLAMAGVGIATKDPQAALQVPADVWEWGTNMNRAAIKYTNAP